MMAKLLAEPALRESVARRGKERIRREYLWEKVAKETEAVYFSMLKLTRKKLAGNSHAIGKAA